MSHLFVLPRIVWVTCMRMVFQFSYDTLVRYCSGRCQLIWTPALPPLRRLFRRKILFCMNMTRQRTGILQKILSNSLAWMAPNREKAAENRNSCKPNRVFKQHGPDYNSVEGRSSFSGVHAKVARTATLPKSVVKKSGGENILVQRQARREERPRNQRLVVTGMLLCECRLAILNVYEAACLVRRSHSRTCCRKGCCLLCELEQHVITLRESGRPLSASKIIVESFLSSWLHLICS